MANRHVIALLAAMLPAVPTVTAQAAPATHPALLDLNETPLIPLADFFAPRAAKRAFAVSPDGRMLLWLESDGHLHDLMVEDLAHGGKRVLASSARPMRYRWAPDSRHIVYLADREGDENTHVFALDSTAAPPVPRNLTPDAPGRVIWIARSRADPRRIIVQMRPEPGATYGLYGIDVATGAAELVAAVTGRRMSYLLGPDDRPWFRVRHYTDGGWVFERRDPSGNGWRTFILGGLDDNFVLRQLPVPPTQAFALSNRGRDRNAVVRVDLESGAETVLHDEETVDITGFWQHPRNGAPLLAWSAPGHPRYRFFDPELARRLAAVRPPGPHVLHLSASDDLAVLVATVDRVEKGSATYLLERAAAPRRLAQGMMAGHRGGLAQVRPVAFDARDGLALHGYLTRLPALQGRTVPCVVDVHGGPWGRDHWGYNGWVQFLASRGYAVLQVNYRGSFGYGRAFTEAGEREFGGAMLTDVLDGLQWAIDSGICDADATAISGGSFGGYLALLAASRQPQRFAALVAINPATDLAGLVRDLETTMGWIQPRLRRYWGNRANAEDRAAMDRASPIHLVDRYQVPLLVIQGANDVRVRRARTDAFVAALQAAGKQVDYLLLDGVGHAIRDTKRLFATAAAVDSYLAERLGGRSE